MGVANPAHREPRVRVKQVKKATTVDKDRNLEPAKRAVKGGDEMPRSLKFMLRAQEHQKKMEERKRIRALSPEEQKKPENQAAFEQTVAERSRALEFAPGTTVPTTTPQFEGQMPGESFFDMNRRIKSELLEATKQKVAVDTRRVEKNREYREKQKAKEEEKKRRRLTGMTSDDEQDEEEGKISSFSKLSAEQPRFGEQAQRPPIFTSLPRNSLKADLQVAKKVKLQGVTSNPLTAFAEKKKAAKLASVLKFDRSTTPTTEVKKTVQTESEKRAMEELRARVRDSYKALKEKRKQQGTNAITERVDPEERQRHKKKHQVTGISDEDMRKWEAMMPPTRKEKKAAKRDDPWANL